MAFYRLLLVVALLLAASSGFAQQLSGEISMAGGLAPNPFEIKTYAFLKTLVNDLSESKDVRVEMVSGLMMVEYQIFFHPNDEKAVRGLSGVTQSAIATLLNELSIASQRDDAHAAARPFDLHKRKYILVRFVKLEL